MDPVMAPRAGSHEGCDVEGVATAAINMVDGYSVTLTATLDLTDRMRLLVGLRSATRFRNALKILSCEKRGIGFDHHRHLSRRTAAIATTVEYIPASDWG
jgi:hypothetical protein